MTQLTLLAVNDAGPETGNTFTPPNTCKNLRGYVVAAGSIHASSTADLTIEVQNPATGNWVTIASYDQTALLTAFLASTAIHVAVPLGLPIRATSTAGHADDDFDVDLLYA